MDVSTLNKYLSTFLLFLVVIGYPLVTTIFLPDVKLYDGTEGNVAVTRMVTVPFRATVLAVSLAVIVTNWNRRIRINLPLRLYFIFWFLLSLRIIYDLLIRTDVIVDPSVVQNQFLYAYLTCLLPAIAIFRGIKAIDFDLAFRMIFWGYVLLIPLLALNSPTLFSMTNTGKRLFGNIAMNPVSLGIIGMCIVLMTIYWVNHKSTIWRWFAAGMFIVAGIFIILRSGSRGPLMTLVVGLLFFLISRPKSPLIGLSLTTVFGTFMLFFKDMLFETIAIISPVIASRMTLSGRVTQFEELSNGRSGEYSTAIEKFLNHPVIGDTYAIIFPDGGLSYSHNIILDAFMGLGLFGGILFISILIYAAFSSYLTIHRRQVTSWIGLLCIAYITSHMTSGCFYQADTLNALLVVVLFLL